MERRTQAPTKDIKEEADDRLSVINADLDFLIGGYQQLPASAFDPRNKKDTAVRSMEYIISKGNPGLRSKLLTASPLLQGSVEEDFPLSSSEATAHSVSRRHPGKPLLFVYRTAEEKLRSEIQHLVNEREVVLNLQRILHVALNPEYAPYDGIPAARIDTLSINEKFMDKFSPTRNRNWAEITDVALNAVSPIIIRGARLAKKNRDGNETGYTACSIIKFGDNKYGSSEDGALYGIYIENPEYKGGKHQIKIVGRESSATKEFCQLMLSKEWQGAEKMLSTTSILGKAFIQENSPGNNYSIRPRSSDPLSIDREKRVADIIREMEPKTRVSRINIKAMLGATSRLFLG